MYRNKKIALVIPCHNEEKLIKPTLERVPQLIDRIYVIDDGSTDGMDEVVRECMKDDSRIELIQHPKNLGVGQAVITGYKKSAEKKYNLTVVIGGDNQMPLECVKDFLDPLIEGKADYAKGNRFLIEGSVFEDMPRLRLLGNSLITLLTKIASGFYRIYDMVDGYTAITRRAITMINWDKAWKKYGYPMDFLVRLNTYGLKVIDVPRRAIYLPGERQSQIKGLPYAIRVTPMLIRGFFWRLTKRFIFRDFHPLVFFYFLGIIFFLTGLIWGIVLIWQQVSGRGVSGPRAVLCSIFLIMGIQFSLTAMLFDMHQSE